MPCVTAIVPAAGPGKRFGQGVKKPFADLLGKPLVVWALEVLEACPEVREIVPVFRAEDLKDADDLLKKWKFSKVRNPAPGGRERQDSVFNGLSFVSDRSCTVLIHDGARPLLTREIMDKTLNGLRDFDGAVSAVPPKDTIKEASAGGLVTKTLRRNTLWSVQTPQVFPFATIMRAFEQAAKEGYYSTDDSALVEMMGGRVNIVPGSYENIKVTTPDDLYIAAALLEKRLPG